MENIKRLTILGGGAMGSAFAGGVIASGLLDASSITVTDIDEARLAAAAEMGVNVTADAAAAVRGADVVLLAVKPGVVSTALTGIAGALEGSELIITIAAGVTLAVVELDLPAGTPVIRAMPNTPCLVRSGAVGFSRGFAADDSHAALAKQIFEAVGIAFEVPEKLLNAVTGLSGSGPAYVFVMIEALSDAGVRVGLPRETATRLAGQTVLGSAKMVMETGSHPAQLKDQVTSPGGTTIAGLDALEQAGFRSALIEAVKAAVARAETLG